MSKAPKNHTSSLCPQWLSIFIMKIVNNIHEMPKEMTILTKVCCLREGTPPSNTNTGLILYVSSLQTLWNTPSRWAFGRVPFWPSLYPFSTCNMARPATLVKLWFITTVSSNASCQLQQAGSMVVIHVNTCLQQFGCVTSQIQHELAWRKQNDSE